MFLHRLQEPGIQARLKKCCLSHWTRAPSERLVIRRSAAHLGIWLPSASLGLPVERSRPKVTHESAIWSQSSLLIPSTNTYKNIDQRSKDRANCSQNRRDGDSQNMQDVMVFENADNDSWRMSGLHPKRTCLFEVVHSTLMFCNNGK